MRKIGLIAYGSLGKQIENLIGEIYTDDYEVYYFDDNAKENELENARSFYDFSRSEYADLEFVVCLGYKNLLLKKEIMNTLLQQKRIILNLIHPTSYISPKSSLGKGIVIYPMCNVDQGVILKDGILLNNSVTVSHNSEVGECSFLAPGVTLSGYVKIGSCCFLGTNTSVANNITLGNNCIIALGTAVIKSVPENSSLIGNPAKILSRKIKLH